MSVVLTLLAAAAAWTLVALSAGVRGGAATAALAQVAAGARSGGAAPPGAYGSAEGAGTGRPRAGPTDSATSLAEADALVSRCTGDCTAVLLAWTPRMPLSLPAVAHAERAAASRGAQLVPVRSEDLRAYARNDAGGALRVADAMLEAGSLAHAPALVVFHGGARAGPAVLGYKSAPAYASLIGRRLTGADGGRSARTAYVPDGVPSTRPAPRTPTATSAPTDYTAVGRPGAYFRWVPNRNAIAYESAGRVYLLDLRGGVSRNAPGHIDFIPTPDGRFFVTPGPTGRPGLRFYDADEVFEAAEHGTSADVEPIYTDRQMRDQYPSVGILETDGQRTVYRVLTSWFDGLVYREYEVVRRPAPDGPPSIRPLGPPVVPCRGTPLSTPIVSRDGTEVAARDERTGTTKIFWILEDGRCSESLDLGTATSKVAWHPTGHVLAFAVPPRNRRGGRARGGVAGAADASSGMFLYDRRTRRTTRATDSRNASLFAFPDFVGEDALVFLVSPREGAASSAFRVVGIGG